MMMQNKRALQRMMRFLEKGNAVRRMAATTGRVLVEAGERGTIGVEEGDLDIALRAGLVEEDQNVLSLTQTGRMALKRLEASADPYRAQHQEREVAVMTTASGRQRVAVDHAESPLALLWRRRTRDGTQFLTAREFRAGERLRADYTRGQIMARMGVNWNAAGGGGGRKAGEANGIADLTDSALAARMRVEKAIEAVGPELAGVLIDICCFLKGMERVETERRWPARSAKVVLKSALAALARHYEPPQQGVARETILHWGAEGYRPRISG